VECLIEQEKLYFEGNKDNFLDKELEYQHNLFTSVSPNP